MKRQAIRPWTPILAAAMLATLLILPGQASAQSDAPAQPAPNAGPASHHGIAHHQHSFGVVFPKELEFRNEMRKLWEDHVVWTRMVIVSFAADLPDLPLAAERLLRNQDDIGEAVVPFYGQAAGDELAALLREHILIAVDVLVAAKADDQPALEEALAAWDDNAVDIATFLSEANPRNWPLAEMIEMMREHLALTTQEAVLRLTGDFEADIETYDAVHEQALGMADMLSTGIIQQFPLRFIVGR